MRRKLLIEQIKRTKNITRRKNITYNDFNDDICAKFMSALFSLTITVSERTVEDNCCNQQMQHVLPVR